MKKIGLILLGIVMGLTANAQEKAHTQVSVTNFNNEPIPGAQIEFFNTKKNEVIREVSNDEGKFTVDLEAGMYNIRLKSVGKSKDYSAIEIPALKEGEVYNDVQIQIQYEEEHSFTLSDLHFKSGESIIQKDSYTVLDELVTYLNHKKDLRIEVGGHTDNNGSEQSNLTLSQNRADAVKTYLVKKGITSGRIETKGYGELKPIADNGDPQGQALNRRTEITIIK